MGVALLHFQPLQPRKKLAREQRSFGFHHLIQKPGLVHNVARFGLIETGSSKHVQFRGFHLRDSILQSRARSPRLEPSAK